MPKFPAINDFSLLGKYRQKSEGPNDVEQEGKSLHLHWWIYLMDWVFLADSGKN